MDTTVQQWGNSLGIRIPKSIADELNITRNSRVDITINNGQITITPIQKPAYKLEELLAQITEENLHVETDTGAITGNELW